MNTPTRKLPLGPKSMFFPYSTPIAIPFPVDKVVIIHNIKEFLVRRDPIAKQTYIYNDKLYNKFYSERQSLTEVLNEPSSLKDDVLNQPSNDDVLNQPSNDDVLNDQSSIKDDKLTLGDEPFEVKFIHSIMHNIVLMDTFRVYIDEIYHTVTWQTVANDDKKVIAKRETDEEKKERLNSYKETACNKRAYHFFPFLRCVMELEELLPQSREKHLDDISISEGLHIVNAAQQKLFHFLRTLGITPHTFNQMLFRYSEDYSELRRLTSKKKFDYSLIPNSSPNKNHPYLGLVYSWGGYVPDKRKRFADTYGIYYFNYHEPTLRNSYDFANFIEYNGDFHSGFKNTKYFNKIVLPKYKAMKEAENRKEEHQKLKNNLTSNF